MTQTPILMDDRAEPALRTIIGNLLARASTTDFAVSRLRLDGIDLTGAELEHIDRCRLLIGRLDAQTLEELMGIREDRPAQRHHLQNLHAFLASGRLEVRAAGIIAWNPDFSIFDGLRDAPAPAIALLGAHYFQRPYPIDGAAFTMMISRSTQIAHLQKRFEELWGLGYDVGEVVRAALEDLEAELDSTTTPSTWNDETPRRELRSGTVGLSTLESTCLAHHHPPLGRPRGTRSPFRHRYRRAP